MFSDTARCHIGHRDGACSQAVSCKLDSDDGGVGTVGACGPVEDCEFQSVFGASLLVHGVGACGPVGDCKSHGWIQTIDSDVVDGVGACGPVEDCESQAVFGARLSVHGVGACGPVGDCESHEAVFGAGLLVHGWVWTIDSDVVDGVGACGPVEDCESRAAFGTGLSVGACSPAGRCKGLGSRIWAVLWLSTQRGILCSTLNWYKKCAALST
jgi:hypothetical protein